MKKKIVTSSILAAFVATAMSGCDSATDNSTIGLGGSDVETFTVKSAEDCKVNSAGTEEQCSTAYKKAEEEHFKSAPKYGSMDECSSSTETKCTQTYIQNPDGSSSSVFMPMMMGMIVGNMINGSSYRAMPVYNDRDGRSVTSGGAYVPKGHGYTGSNTFSSPARSGGFVKPNTSTFKASPSISMRSGGFGKSGGFGGATG